MQERVRFRDCGARGSFILPRFAIRRDDETPLEAVVRAITRKTGLTVWPVQADGAYQHEGRIVEQRYHATLGRRTRDGGLEVQGELWFAIPIN